MSRLTDKWQELADREEECSALIAKYEIYERQLFSTYEPLSIANQNILPRAFLDRLDMWLKNFSTDEDQWNAFKLVEDIFYLGRNELVELYRVAFEVTVPSWISQIAGISLLEKNYKERIQFELERTWFCPITDSLKISVFRHVNHVEHPSYFPDWRSLANFGNAEKIKKYISESNIKQIVLMEDFVGSGKQISPAVQYAGQISDVPVLIMPLVIGSSGHAKMSSLVANFPMLSFAPIITLGSDTVITKKIIEGESPAAKRARDLTFKYRKITNDKNPFGFERNQGYLFISEANCPNNTLRLIHATSNWKALFPRSGRKT